MTGRMAGKHALVTAAGQGIGYASAVAMAREGAHVTATDINAELLQRYRDIPNVRTALLDVTDANAIDGVVRSLPALDVLFNCAGVVRQGSVLECTIEDWEFSFELNVCSMFYMIRSAIPRLIARGGGSIVNMSSVCSSIRGLPNRFIYGTTKAAIIGLTKSVAADFVGKGIRCNAVCPATVDTPSLQERINSAKDPDQMRLQMISRQPMGRIGTPEEVAALVLFLASDESRYITGNAYTVDGGMTI